MDETKRTARLGLGFEDPNDFDGYSDTTGLGSRSLQENIDITSHHATFLSDSVRSMGKIEGNPSAGSIRRKELTEPFIAVFQEEIVRENEEADDLILNKRVTGLARQTQDGLGEVGVKVDGPSLAPRIMEGFKMKGKDLSTLSEAKAQEAMENVQLLDACQKFDLERIIEILGCKKKEEITFGTTRFA